MDYMACVLCKVSPIYKNARSITTCSAEAQIGHTNLANHKRADKGKAKLERGEEENKQKLYSNKALFKTHLGAIY